jgi:hypothetical protein
MAQANLRPLADTLTAVAHEMADLAGLAEKLQGVIADLVAHGGVLGAHAAVDCQAADALSQRLAGMAEFFHRLAEAAPQAVEIDAASATRTLSLSDQADRLAGQQSPRSAGGTGELELFGV